MREVIAWEGIDIGNHRVIEVGALQWGQGEQIPVVVESGPLPPVVGYATDLRREPNNQVTAEITITHDTFEIPHGAALTVYADNLEIDGDIITDPSVVIKSARIREIFTPANVPWQVEEAFRKGD